MNLWLTIFGAKRMDGNEQKIFGHPIWWNDEIIYKIRNKIKITTTYFFVNQENVTEFGDEHSDKNLVANMMRRRNKL